MKLQPDDAIDPARLRRVLVIKLRHHGDVLLTSPVLQALQEAAPQAEIDALIAHVKKWSPVANTFTRPVNLDVGL